MMDGFFGSYFYLWNILSMNEFTSAYKVNKFTKNFVPVEEENALLSTITGRFWILSSPPHWRRRRRRYFEAFVIFVAKVLCAQCIIPKLLYIFLNWNSVVRIFNVNSIDWFLLTQKRIASILKRCFTRWTHANGKCKWFGGIFPMDFNFLSMPFKNF